MASRAKSGRLLDLPFGRPGSLTRANSGARDIEPTFPLIDRSNIFFLTLLIGLNARVVRAC